MSADLIPVYSEFRKTEPTAPTWNGAAVGCTVCATASAIERYTAVRVANLTTLGNSMGARCRAWDGCTHGIPGKSTWGACCAYLELAGRGLPFAYRGLTWAGILDAIGDGRWVILPGKYLYFPKVSTSSYSAIKPANGRSDSFTGLHMVAVAGRKTSTTAYVADADFGSSARPVMPPHSEISLAILRRYWEATGWNVAVANTPPPKPGGIEPEPGPNPPGTYKLVLAPGAEVRSYKLQSGGCILPGWTDSTWGPQASSAACAKPVARSTCDGASGATTSLVINGVYAGQHLRVGVKGVSVEAT